VYSIGVSAFSPNIAAKPSRTAVRRSFLDSGPYFRQVEPPTKASSTPGSPEAGELSKTARAAPASLMPKPLRPSSRQNGVS
jgi:hypothetical protein